MKSFDLQSIGLLDSPDPISDGGVDGYGFVALEPAMTGFVAVCLSWQGNQASRGLLSSV
jgi:hypothetical protein